MKERKEALKILCLGILVCFFNAAFLDALAAAAW